MKLCNYAKDFTCKPTLHFTQTVLVHCPHFRHLLCVGFSADQRSFPPRRTSCRTCSEVCGLTPRSLSITTERLNCSHGMFWYHRYSVRALTNEALIPKTTCGRYHFSLRIRMRYCPRIRSKTSTPPIPWFDSLKMEGCGTSIFCL